MTTVAYKNGIMACDSRCSDEDRHMTKCEKIYRLKSGALLGICGDDDTRELEQLLDGVYTSTDLPSRESLAELKLEGAYLLVLPNEEVWNIVIECREFSNTDEWLGGARQIKEEFAAIGSGSHLAIGAMEFGASAEEAVECAAKWDLYSAPPIQTLELKQKEKKRERK